MTRRAYNEQIILLLCILVIPGVFLGEAYISPTDFVIPLLFFYEFVKDRRKGKLKLRRENIVLVCFIGVCFLSVIFASLSDGTFYGVALLKCFRLLECLMIIYIEDRICKKGIIEEKNTTEKLLITVLIFGIITTLTAIYLFLTQSMLFKPNQLMSFNGRVMRRAEGIFGDAQSFSLVMTLIFSVALTCYIRKINRLLAIISMAVTSVAIVFSDTRTAFFALVVSTVYVLLKHGIMRPKTFAIIFALIIISIITYFNNPYLNRFINERISPVVKAITALDYTDLAVASSHRFEIWSNSLQRFTSNNIIQKIIGTGYKVSNDATDNFFVYALMTTGIVGAIFVVQYWIQTINHSSKKSDSLLHNVVSANTIVYLVFMFLCDAMTLYRALFLFVFLKEVDVMLIKKSPALPTRQTGEICENN